jgi:uncharacterized protein YndB with AHSA1/START domain
MTDKPASSFVYVTFIRATTEKIWAAVTEPEFMKEYWYGMHFATDWKVGSRWQMIFPDGRIADSGEIIENVHLKRLVLKWTNEWKPELHAEGAAVCTIELEPVGDVVKLTITHEMNRPDSKLIEAVSGGWPRILSNLKSLLETGQVIMKT